MNARNWLYLIGTLLLALGPELQMEGGSKLEWRLGRYARLCGAVLMGSRVMKSEPSKPKPTKRNAHS